MRLKSKKWHKIVLEHALEAALLCHGLKTLPGWVNPLSFWYISTRRLTFTHLSCDLFKPACHVTKTHFEPIDLYGYK